MRTVVRLIVTLVAFVAVVVPFGLAADAAPSSCRPPGTVEKPGEKLPPPDSALGRKLRGQPPLTKEQLAKMQEVKQGRDEFAKLAKRLGVSAARLDAALRKVKLAMGAENSQGRPQLRPAIVTRFARELGISQHRARQVLVSLFVTNGPGSSATKSKDPATGKAPGACG